MKRLLITLLVLGSTALAQAPAPAKKAGPAPAPTAKTEAKPAPAPAAGGYVGNKDSKVLHKADCKQGASMKAANRVPFTSKAEAEKAGYKACKVCKP
ncbi:Ada metal-binding domain-containing protein [Geothrix sp. PMB-07]|uniref:Ada metal-binding domain-containing protein n=1 Tax=Geothrix sp. PMB-07 TaxID=3068640 RepID=UPI0027411172|nr:Ada metal-binding domain-containing protein [Geothrix sp. PMB-07]WLT31267.1 Ada metal-binding domain-containing protein [Geothrix sp. PMB-07]